MSTTPSLRNQLSPNCVDALYTPTLIPQFAGNPLIEALPPSELPSDLIAALSSRPLYSEEQRGLAVPQRLQMLKSLSSFLFPLERHITLALELDSMLRNGYVSRRPATPEYAKTMQKIYEQKSRLDTDSVDDFINWEQPSGLLLIGKSGMGKTRFIKRWASRYPSVIYHPQLHAYQIPVLHIELPADGESLTGLCGAIFTAVDKLIPGSNYVETYSLKGRPTVEQLIRRVEAVMHAHCVGMLVCDEVQNLTNAGKAKGRLMTELVSMSNLLSIPLVFIGTNKAAKLFGQDFRQARRVTGLGSQHWDRLHEGTRQSDGTLVSEWRDFIDFMWNFQWTSITSPLTEEIRTVMYQYCQGVIDIAIKLFVAAQARAILDGTDEVKLQHIRDAYQQDFQVLHPMLAALREGNFKELAEYPDIAPTGLGSLVDSLASRRRAATSPAYTTTPADEDFGQKVVAAVVTSGFSEELAWSTYKEVASQGRGKNLSEAVHLCLEKLSTVTKSRKKQKASKADGATTGPARPSAQSLQPGDIRTYIAEAKATGRVLLDVMTDAGALKPVHEILRLPGF